MMQVDAQPFYAHSSPTGCEPPAGWQLLREHLRCVAARARELAEATRVEDLPGSAEVAGWLHDVGKYRPSFQEFIRGRSPMGSKQHKEAGAAWAAEAGDLPVAFAVLGHHVGVPDRDEASAAVKGPDGLAVAREVEAAARRDCPQLAGIGLVKRNQASAATDLFTRLLLSCLVDADWCDTGEHERLVKGWPEFPTPPELEPAERLTRLLAFIARRAASTREKNPSLAATRERILNACLAAGERPPGLFSLTVPTGGGKTLSGLAFALRHAAVRDLRRVIYVAPYISILEQNADVIRVALGVDEGALDLFEHQSLAEPQGPRLADERQTSAAARRAENWDSPLVVTTNVQFFESLFSNKPGRCRKLHNVARSVVILDECQTLPPELVKPTCQMLKQLTAALRCTVVLCTATQPAFDHQTLGEHRLDAREIVPSNLPLFDQLKRVHLDWPASCDERLAWPEVAKRMTGNTSALGVVNTKQAALDLFAALKVETHHAFHLSTSMCPAHRAAVLSEVKRRLGAKQPVFVASTQLIEAGVDIDFPCVFREMAPLESIIQAAGRCNREGLIPNAGGRVVVFRSVEGEVKIPPGWYKMGRDVLETILRDNKQPGIDSAEDIRSYFHELYWKRSLDPHNVVGMRAGARFQSVADAYRLIGDDTVPFVVATWADHAAEVERLLTELRTRPTRANFRALSPYQVNVFRRQGEALYQHLEQWAEPELRVWRGQYDPEVGLIAEGPDELVV
jgi:CRISPR-associated endonuclease/helicase Cas3